MKPNRQQLLLKLVSEDPGHAALYYRSTSELVSMAPNNFNTLVRTLAKRGKLVVKKCFADETNVKINYLYPAP